MGQQARILVVHDEPLIRALSKRPSTCRRTSPSHSTLTGSWLRCRGWSKRKR